MISREEIQIHFLMFDESNPFVYFGIELIFAAYLQAYFLKH